MPVDDTCAVFTKANCFGGERYRGKVYFVSCNDRPYTSFYQHGEADRWQFSPMGSRIKWADISTQLRRCLMNEYEDLWQIRFSHDSEYFISSWRPMTQEEINEIK